MLPSAAEEKECDLYYICKPLTPSKNEEEPPLLGETIKHQYQQEVGHDAFTQHPAVGSQEEVLCDGSDRLTGSLKCELVKQLSFKGTTSFSKSNRFSQTQTVISYILCTLQY